MTPRILNAVCVGIGAALGYLFGDWLDRRRAERRTLTAADQQWMAATHDKGTDG
jgi:membrane protein YqaA with SNARE-associated domain